MMTRTYSPSKPPVPFNGRYMTQGGGVIRVQNSLFVVKGPGEPEVQLVFDSKGNATSKEGVRLPNYDLKEMIREGSGL